MAITPRSLNGVAAAMGMDSPAYVCRIDSLARYTLLNQGRHTVVPFPVVITYHGMKSTCYSICANFTEAGDDAFVANADARRRGKFGGHAAGFTVEGIRDAAAGPILIYVGLQIIGGIP